MTMVVSAQDSSRWPVHHSSPNIPAPTQRPIGAKQRLQSEARRHHNRQDSFQRRQNEINSQRTRQPSIPHPIRTDDSRPSSRSGGRFAVGNVGSNGIIYLRPVPRPRPTPEPFVFPPNVSTDLLDKNNKNTTRHDALRSASNSPVPPTPPSPSYARPLRSAAAAPNVPATVPERHPSQRARSHSYSTFDDSRSQSFDSNTFKVVIDRPSLKRTKSVDSLQGSHLVLDVPIPNYRLGTPRFSTHGSAFLRSSIQTRYSGADDMRSSIFTRTAPSYDKLFPQPSPMLNRNSLRESAFSSQSGVFFDRPHTFIDPSFQTSPPTPTPHAPSTPISPGVYDSLYANPNDPLVVRYSPTGDIVAATPARLVAHITSPSSLDYELLSDFFLTFRSYLNAKDLVSLLIARLRWAVERKEDFGRIVRVRTFVALRHWILNYFAEDFIPCILLRQHFCLLVNKLYTDTSNRPDGGGGDVKIIGELKKCWRRTCGSYWTNISVTGKELLSDQIFPGGAADEIPRPGDISDRQAFTAPLEPLLMPRPIGGAPHTRDGVTAEKQAEWMKTVLHMPHHPVQANTSDGNSSRDAPLSPASEMSLQVLSCSIPLKSLYRGQHASVPHPVPINRTSILSPPFPASIGTRGPVHMHSRSGEDLEAVGVQRPPSTVSFCDSHGGQLMTIQLPGSLVRGLLFQPDSPFISMRSSGKLRPMRSHLQIELDPNDPHLVPRPTTPNPGVKRIFGSVRRALSSRQGSAAGGSSMTKQRDSLNAGTPSASNGPAGGVQKRRPVKTAPHTRIDVLLQRAGESFKKALEAELETERQTRQSETISRRQTLEPEEQQDESRETRPDSQVVNRPSAERGLSKLTLRSGSILIFDDTERPPVPSVSSAVSEEGAEGSTAAPDTNQFDDALAQTPPCDSPRQISEEELQRGSHVSLPPITMPPEMSAPTATAGKPVYPTDHYRLTPSDGMITNNVSANLSAVLRHSRSAATTPDYSSSSQLQLRRFASQGSGVQLAQTDESDISPSVSPYPGRGSEGTSFRLDTPPPRPPGRMLRRRPGGNLRAVHNVCDLDRQSTGSLSDFTHSVGNSVALQSAGVWSTTGPGTNTVDNSHRRKSMSLVATHSSQPVLRPSFEAEVARLASLPDDDEDDGGIESALLKLEGKYERKSAHISPRHTDFYVPTGAPAQPRARELSDSKHEKLQHRHEQINTEGFVDVSALKNPFPAPSLHGQQPSQTSLRETPRKTEPEQSDMSYSSIPLLDRGTNYYDYYQPTRPDDSTDSALPAPLAPERWRAPKQAAKNDSAGSSMEHVVETDSIRQIPRGATMPRSPQSPQSPAMSSKAHRSLLANYEDEFDDISSDISTNRPDSRPESHGVRSFYEDQPADLGPHDNISRVRFPPTPPKDNAGDDFGHNSIDFATFIKGLPTPGFTPPFRSGHAHAQAHSEARNNPRFSFVQEPQIRQEPERSRPKHIPFILAYDSATLAEQFTVIEKDALDEIDWKELIELRWKQSSPQIRDWVDYLRTQEPRGVDVVIARFNIMVKWAVSQCVLTEDIDERVRTLVKYIRIASHARRLRNYATMYQFTVALLSSDCARLHRTWEMVPAADRRTLRELENLVQPVKNFYNLRLEMEMASLEDGCIPFVGIYTRDLVYNAQKPATLGEGNGGPLINFERHQTAATIVKSLLRLLEASGRYNMHARTDVISKCLWVAALSDDEITKRSRALE
ncbi:hypothetical protein JOL62DRAFT_232081 [Phyllosticta paracitricarpa]|uniref:Ras GEF n=1 Tax=Phyllosticta paracitricarpa TaxID=2016321 RepID=A0ABR1NKI9_9PEZI